MAKAQFDRNDVLDKSIGLFWENGFSASSMKQVENVTGLKPGSLYFAFGNKEALFSEALQRYAEMSQAKIRRMLDDATSVGAGLCEVLEMVAQDSTQKNFNSCFLVKTQLELTAEGNDLHDLALAKLSEMEEIYRTYLAKDYSPAVSRRRAASIMLHIFGMRVYGYQRDAVDVMRQGLREGLPWLPWDQVV